MLGKATAPGKKLYSAYPVVLSFRDVPAFHSLISRRDLEGDKLTDEKILFSPSLEAQSELEIVPVFSPSCSLSMCVRCETNSRQTSN